MRKDSIPDEKKLIAALTAAAMLVAAVLALNLFSEYLVSEWGGYLKRRVYYERVIKKKGLTLHRGMYWRRSEEQQ